MRIVAGRWRGHPIQAPPGRTTRPTTDRVREAWMSSMRPRLVGEDHIKLELEQAGARLTAIGFRMRDRLPDITGRERVDVAFQLQENHWNGKTELQARLVDVREAE